MPGVVAGFPAKAPPAVIVITTQYETPDYGGYDAGVLGAITPPGSSAIPGAAAVVGAAGEILRVIYERYEGFTHQMFVTVRGQFATVPFSSLAIDSQVVSGFSVYYADSSQTTFRTRSISENPIPAGTHALVFG